MSEDYRVSGSPCGYEDHQLNSWYESRLKRAVSLALTEGGEKSTKHELRVKNTNIRLILTTIRVCSFFLFGGSTFGVIRGRRFWWLWVAAFCDVLLLSGRFTV